MMRRTVLLVPVAAMLSASGPVPRIASVTRQRGAPPAAGSFAVVPEPLQLGTPVFDLLARQAEADLRERGFRAAAEPALAELHVVLRYGMEETRAVSCTPPAYAQPAPEAPCSVMLSGPSFSHWLQFEFLDAIKLRAGRRQALYRSRAVCQALERDGATVLPFVLQAIMRDIPRQTAQAGPAALAASLRPGLPTASDLR